MNTFKVICWDLTKDEHEFYDVLPYFQRELSSLIKKRRIRKKDVTLEWLKDFVQKEAKYMFWSRCEYEIIVSGWPCQKNEEKLENFILSMTGKDSSKLSPTELENFTKTFNKTNEVKIVDPVGLKEKLDKLREEIDNFASEIDAILSEANATVTIEV